MEPCCQYCCYPEQLLIHLHRMLVSVLTTTTLSITVDPLITPTFTPVDDVCQNSAAPALPTTSINGITGTWSPAVSTATPGTTTYTFTPDAGQCATTTTLSITVDPLVTPTFTPVDDVCQNSAAPVLPTTSINGITGTWSSCCKHCCTGNNYLYIYTGCRSVCYNNYINHYG